MQDNFSVMAYAVTMTAKNHCTDLKALREAAGLSLRELACQIGEDHSNVRYWETSGHTPRSDVLIPMAKALGSLSKSCLAKPSQKGLGRAADWDRFLKLRRDYRDGSKRKSPSSLKPLSKRSLWPLPDCLLIRPFHVTT